MDGLLPFYTTHLLQNWGWFTIALQNITDKKLPFFWVHINPGIAVATGYNEVQPAGTHHETVRCCLTVPGIGKHSCGPEPWMDG